ncbi:MAG: SUMF1/EgtB/PvdO family nonheme iron enzyme [Spirochaetales bacterium]|nr:SUMF1/EgtB/PvdO family nonheme iron enzyme [Spirochaetales bacterium]
MKNILLIKIVQAAFLFSALLAHADNSDEYIKLEFRPLTPKISEPESAATPKPRKTWTDPATGMEYIWVPEGCFIMGSNNGSSAEKPLHKVCVDGFWMAKYEVTQAEWTKLMGSNPSFFKSNHNPVETVSWYDAQNFIKKLNSKGNGKFRLPTEAEWEYAARSGGKNQEYAGGDNVDAVAWYTSNSGERTHEVGTKSPNGLGLYDMSGNVGEWCEDLYSAQAYSKHSLENPVNKSGGDGRITRGGGWSDITYRVRTTNRFGYNPVLRYSYFGFRLVRTD